MEETIMEPTALETPEAVDTPPSDIADVNQEPASSSESQPTYKVKVQGEEIEVSLDELLKGYQRQADYTRKAQELAAQRRQLQTAEAFIAALEQNPQQVIANLAREYGLTIAEATRVARNMEDDFYSEPEDPIQQKLAEFERWKEQQEQAKLQERIDRQLADLHSKYGEFDEDELFAFAVKHQIADLEIAHRAMTYDNLRKEAEEIKAAQQRARDAEREQAKREASVVSGGSAVTPASVTPAPKEIRSIRDAFELARQQLGQ